MFPKEKQNCTQNLRHICFVFDAYDNHIVRNFLLQYLVVWSFWGFFKCLFHCFYSSSGNFKEQGDFIATECSAFYASEQPKRNF